MNEELDQIFSDKLFHYIKDGIIVMNASRKIVKANRAANRLIGWGIGEHVPYCSYCEQREVKPGEERCYLMANKGEIPYFSSEMPTFGEYLLDVEMSNVMIYHDEKANEKYYLLVLRDQTLKKKEEEARISKKMIQPDSRNPPSPGKSCRPPFPIQRQPPYSSAVGIDSTENPSRLHISGIGATMESGS